LFLVFNDKGKRVGEAVAQKTTDPKTGKEIYIPKKGTVVFK
jgi:nucleoid DNA-binding protein